MFSIFVFVTIFACVLTRDLPSYFPKCRLHDEFLGECIINASETLRPYLRKGIPELGISSIDPLFIPEISLSQGTDAVNVKVKLSNVTIHGFDTYKFENVNYNIKTLNLQSLAHFDNVTIESNYDLEGKVLALPILGTGKARGFLARGTSKINCEAELITKKGEKYYKPVKVKITLGIGDVEMMFDGLLNENEELSQATHRVLRENAKEIITEMLPAIEKVAEEIFTKTMEALNKNVPYNKLFIIEEQE